MYGPHVSKTSRNLKGFTILEPEIKNTSMRSEIQPDFHNAEQRASSFRDEEVINLLLIRFLSKDFHKDIRAETSLSVFSFHIFGPEREFRKQQLMT